MALDLVVVVLYFIVVMSLGLHFGRGNKSMESFAMGERGIPWWAVVASIIAAEISAATFLGAPGEGYALRNFTYAQFALGTILARVIVSWIFIKPFYDYKVVSIYEFLLIRFGVTTRNAASFIFLITRALASGTRMYVAAIILVLGFELTTGFKATPHQELIIYIGALIFLTIFTAIYTMVGGIKAVVWTDVIQATVMVGSLCFAVWSLLSRIPGGWAGATTYLQQTQDLKFFDSGLQSNVGLWANIKGILQSEYTIWAALLGSTFVTMATHGTDQDMVQRMLTAKDHVRSRLALVLSGLADVPIVLCFLWIGILLYVFYQVHPDPHLPTKNAHIFAYYILHELPAGARGLLVAGIFSTAMGSLSTALNALATSFTKDWYLSYINPQATDQQSVRAARWSTLFFAVLLVGIGAATAWVVIMNPQTRIIPIVLGIFGYTYGSLLGIFLVGALTKTRGSERGNLIAMMSGLIFVAYMSGLDCDLWFLLTGRVYQHPQWVPVIEFPWRIMFGSIMTFVVAMLFKTPSKIQSSSRIPI